MTVEMGDRPMKRVGIVGVGAVGSTTAYAMIQAGAAGEIFLADSDMRRAEGELMDLVHCLPFTRPSRLEVCETQDLEGCDLVIVTAGVAQQPGETRLQLVQRNTEIFASFMEILAKRNPHALFCIVTNPVDIMTRVALELSGLPPHQLFGSGTVLDTARFRVLIARHFDVQPRHVHAHVIGEHGDSEVLVWSRASIGPYRVGEYAQVGRQSLAPDDMERISNEVRDAAYYIIERKGATHFAIGLATVHLLEALAQQQQSIYTVSRQCEGAFGLRGVCLSLPTYLNRGGATGQLEAEISGREEDALKRSAEVLAETYDALPMG